MISATASASAQIRRLRMKKDVSKVSLSLPLYEAYTRGYLSSAKDSLTETETEYMAFSSKLMTYECGIRSSVTI